MKYHLVMELYGNVGPFELSEAAVSDFNAAEEAHRVAREKFDVEKLAYKFDLEVYEGKKEEYDTQQKQIADGDGDLVEEEAPEPTEPVEPELDSKPPKKLAVSKYQEESVGRILFTFEKPLDYRWKRLNM